MKIMRVMWSREGKFLTFVQTFPFFFPLCLFCYNFIVDYLKMPQMFLSSPATSLICFYFIAEYLHGIRAVNSKVIRAEKKAVMWKVSTPKKKVRICTHVEWVQRTIDLMDGFKTMA